MSDNEIMKCATGEIYDPLLLKINNRINNRMYQARHLVKCQVMARKHSKSFQSYQF